MTRAKKPAAVWKAAHGELKLQMTRASFDTWLRDAHLVAEEGNAFVVGVPNVYARDWLEHRLKGVVLRTLKQVSGRDIDLRFIVHTERTDKDDDLRDAGPLLANLKPKPRPSKNGTSSLTSDGLNPRYTFDNFVEGPSNRLARAVALSAAENPGALVNPLYICGGVGLGKSHLMHAIGHHASARGLNVLCVPAETFTNDLVEAIRSNTTAHMREKYRAVDILLIDDVQFIAGKENTQEEFFHTFNALYDQGKQIILTGDKPPHEITSLDGRIRSRLEGGMISDLKPPSLETRIDILKIKAKNHKKTLPASILELIARRANNNVRQLEGALKRVLAYADLTRAQPTLSLAEAALGDLSTSKTNLTLDHVFTAVANYYRIEVEDIQGRGRSQIVSTARQVAMYLAREETDVSLPQIGEGLGGRHHSTVHYSCNRIADRLPTDPLLSSQITLIKKSLEDKNPNSTQP
jgi:chromosomal replication initiator protein